MTFKKGTSGNPRGRKRGVSDRRVAWRAELAEHLPAIVARVVDAAKAGDLEAARLIFARTMPVLRSTGLPVSLPELAKARTTGDQARAVIAAIADGTLSPDQGADLLGALASASRVIEADEIERRFSAIESALNGARDA